MLTVRTCETISIGTAIDSQVVRDYMFGDFGVYAIDEKRVHQATRAPNIMEELLDRRLQE